MCFYKIKFKLHNGLTIFETVECRTLADALILARQKIERERGETDPMLIGVEFK